MFKSLVIRIILVTIFIVTLLSLGVEHTFSRDTTREAEDLSNTQLVSLEKNYYQQRSLIKNQLLTIANLVNHDLSDLDNNISRFDLLFYECSYEDIFF